MKTVHYILTLVLAASFMVACSKKADPIVITPAHFHNTIDKVTEVIIHDIFSPPVASRIYAYPTIAAYEIIASQNPSFTSLAGQLNYFIDLGGFIIKGN